MKNLSTTSKPLVVTIVVLVALASASAIAKNRWWPTTGSPPPQPMTAGLRPSAPLLIQNASERSGEVELVRLTSRGFEPAEITRPAGKFVLGVTNRTGLPELSLRLIHENRRSVGGKRLGREMNWRQVIDLSPGRYALREASHPDWICRITITPR